MYVSSRGERLCLGALAASVGGLQEVLEVLGSAVRDLSLSTRWSPLATSTACIPATQATLTVAAAPQTVFWVSAKTATRPSPRRVPLNDFRGGDGGAEPRHLVYRREESRLIPRSTKFKAAPCSALTLVSRVLPFMVNLFVPDIRGLKQTKAAYF